MKSAGEKGGFKGDLSDAAKLLFNPMPLGAASLSGIEVVTIPLKDYAALMVARRRLARIEAMRPKLMTRTVIDSHPEIKVFVVTRLGKMAFADIAAVCSAAFGERAPAKSTIHRFSQRYIPDEIENTSDLA